MAPRVNCEDAPECGLWSRKQHQVTRIKPYEVESMFEGEKWDDVVKAEDSLVGCMISEIQDPNIEDEVALHLAMVNSQEEASAVASEGNQPLDAARASPSVSQSVISWDSCSEATETWDLCETSSISSSWLDVQHDHAAEQLIEEEDGDLVILKHCASEAPLKEDKPPSFAEILARSIGSSPAPLPRLLKPHWVASRALKPVPEHEADDNIPSAMEDWEMYKSSSSNVQHWRQKRRARKK